MKKKLIFGSLIISAFTLSAQNVSYDANPLFLSGTDNSAIGGQAMQASLFLGGSGGKNCALGANSLMGNTTGNDNVALGFASLLTSTGASRNIGIGSSALGGNNADDNIAIGYYALNINTSGMFNIGLGNNALLVNMIGNNNIGIGNNALIFNTANDNVAVGAEAMYNNTTGIENTGVGTRAAMSNSTGKSNSAFGFNALFNNTASYNAAFGSLALFQNTTGTRNSAFGTYALFNNTIETDNTAMGYLALRSNTGIFNTGIGSQVLAMNSMGSSNTAIGMYACHDNTTADNNTGVGYHALHQNTVGTQNTAVGSQALDNNTASFNTGIGMNALLFNVTGEGNTAVGKSSFASNTTGYDNTGIGASSSANTPTRFNATAVGARAIVLSDNAVQLGDANVTQIVMTQAWNYVGSDARFKTNVKEEDIKGLAFINKLRPVAYNFDTRLYTEFITKNMPDSVKRVYLERNFAASTSIRKSGFIAQEVEKAANETGYNFDGVKAPKDENDHYIVAYSAFVVPLVKAVQEQQKMIDTDKEQIKSLQTLLADQQKLIDQLLGKKIAGTENTNNIDDHFKMGQNIPNPFTHETIIKYTVPTEIKNAYMGIYDLTGKQIANFPLDKRGESTITITNDKLAAGIYIYSIIADGTLVDSKRMIVVE